MMEEVKIVRSSWVLEPLGCRGKWIGCLLRWREWAGRGKGVEMLTRRPGGWKNHSEFGFLERRLCLWLNIPNFFCTAFGGLWAFGLQKRVLRCHTNFGVANVKIVIWSDWKFPSVNIEGSEDLHHGRSYKWSRAGQPEEQQLGGP